MTKQKAPYKIAKDGTVTILNPDKYQIEIAEFAAANYAYQEKSVSEAKKVIAACTTKKELMKQFFPTAAQLQAQLEKGKARQAYINNSPRITAEMNFMASQPDFMPALRK